MKNEGEDKLPCPAKDNINASVDAVNHNYFVLEKHVKETDYSDKLQASNDHDHYTLAQDPTFYEVTNGETEDDYDTTDQGQAGRGKSSQSGNVYNTFNDFKHHDDYDHLGDHKKHPRFTANEYSTTEAAMTQPIDDDTYNHLNQGPHTAARPDNVYGMPRASNDKF